MSLSLSVLSGPVFNTIQIDLIFHVFKQKFLQNISLQERNNNKKKKHKNAPHCAFQKKIFYLCND